MQTRRGFAAVCGLVCVLAVACGSERSPATAQPGTANALGAGAAVVFEDALASGWVDWSWSSTRDLAAASPVSAGTRSLAVTLQAYGGLSLHDVAGSVAGMDALALSIHGGTAGGDFQVFVTKGGQALTQVMLAQYCTGKAIPANAWTRCTVPFSALGAAGAAVDGVGLRDNTGSARATVYLDDVGFVPALPAAPAGLAATASAGQVALAWSPSSGASGYHVYRATSTTGAYTRLTSSPQAATTYVDTAVTAGGQYWYRVAAANAAGTGAASDFATATVPAAATTSYVVFGDALPSGWVDWSWSSTRDFAATSPVAEGTRSVAVTLQPNGGFSLHLQGAAISGMDALTFSIHGGTASGGDFQVFVTQGGQVLTQVMLAQHCAGKAIPANAWTRCTVPFSALGAAGAAVDGVGLRDVSGVARATIHVDDVRFTGGSTPPPSIPAAPVGLAATASTGRISLTWSAASGATGYDVYRATASGGTFTRLTSASQTATTYADAAVTAGSTYWYRVTASNAAGTSAASAVVSATAPTSTSVTVAVAPASTTVDGCATARFTATVGGATDGTVTWSVQEGAAGGTVDGAGNYTAPTTPGTYHVVATSRASSAARATATVVVQEHVLALAVSPASVSMSAGEARQFAATVTTTCGTFTVSQ